MKIPRCLPVGTARRRLAQAVRLWRVAKPACATAQPALLGGDDRYAREVGPRSGVPRASKKPSKPFAFARSWISDQKSLYVGSRTPVPWTKKNVPCFAIASYSSTARW